MSLDVNLEYYLVRQQIGSVPYLNLSLVIQSDEQWELHNDPSMLFLLNGQNIPEILSFGNQSINIKMMNSVNQWSSGLYPLRLRLFNLRSDEPIEKTIIIYLMVTANEEDEIYPNRLDFEAIQNVKPADEQKIFIATGGSGVTFQLPPFLTLIGHELIGGGHIITVKPPYPTQSPQLFTGHIVFDLPEEDHPVNYPVTYRIHGGFDASYSRSIHFTRDNRELIFYKTTTELTFLRLLLLVKTFNNNGTADRDFNFELDVSFIDHHAKINIGLELESYFKSFNTALNQGNRLNSAYRPMEVAMTALEVKYDDFSIVNQDLIPTQRYLRGRNPYSTILKPFWLAFRPNILRYVTENSMIFLQVFKPAGESIQKINVYKNGEFHKAITQSAQAHSFSLAYFIYTTFNVNSIKGIVPGDLIEFEYEGMSVKREFLVKPHQPHSFHVAFQTIWETQDIFEFTGPNSFGVDYSQELSDVMKNYVERSNKVGSSKRQSLIMNTGFIAKSESYLIDELIDAKKAFLILPTQLMPSDGYYISESIGNIELVPVQSKIINHETDANLVSFDVEFKINKRYADEIYSR